jgi:phage protein D
VGLTDYKPAFRIVANREDITTTIRRHLVSLTLTDVTGYEADTLEIVLNSDGVSKPPRGAELELWLGYENSMTKMGVFVVDEIELAGRPQVMTLRARGTPFEQSKLGLLHLQSQKTRVWPRNTKLTDMVSKIAKEHGLKANVSKSLQSITLPQFDQTAESDISFLLRVGVRYDAIVKPGNGKLNVFKRGDIDMPTITVEAVRSLKWSFAETSREREGTVVAFWHKTSHGKRQQVEVGSGEPVEQLRQWFTTESAALAAAKARLDRRKRGGATFTVTVPGNPAISAESNIEPSGFHPDVPTRFIASRAVHRLSARGYETDAECELPIE